MAAPTARMQYETRFDARTGRPVPVAEGLVRITAPNAGPYTFTGTNSFLVGHDEVAVLDPGPDDPGHLAALVAAIAGRRVTAILLTHTHTDHSALVGRLRAASGAPVWFAGQHRLSRPSRLFEFNGVGRHSDFALIPDRVLRDGERIDIGGVGLQIIATPGHCANHICLAIRDTPLLLCGDHVMGWNSTLVSVPDGSMADYLASLRKVIALDHTRYLPAHGGPIADGRSFARALLAHREQRNAQVVAAVAAGATSLRELRRQIYPSLERRLNAAAEMTLAAHVEYLAARGEIGMTAGLFGIAVFPASG